ncbi:MAG: uncharacterized protein A8A55_1595 [Amphiamblys sp. WSBS2006]|nr:MAG: uncharacterized protein A8A55_1603 [Amphiamblys sp. WSBS2006]OIR57639.1 MAG: uncharacterized protein A8A55_1595 [Amphiamblys sp. WSBS2006]
MLQGETAVEIDEDYRLVELCDSGFVGVMKNSSEMFFCGTDDAVMVVDDKSYSVCSVHTTHTMLVVDIGDKKLRCISTDYLELKEQDGNWERLWRGLEKTEYSTGEKRPTRKEGLDERELVCLSQAGTGKTVKRVLSWCAFKENGKFRTVSAGTKHRFMELLFVSAEKKGIALNNTEMKQEIKEDMPGEVAQEVLQWGVFIEWVFGREGIDTEKVLSIVAERQAKSKPVCVEDFFKSVKKTVPSYLEFTEEQLWLFGFVERDSVLLKTLFWFLPPRTIPQDSEECAEFLFELRPRWCCDVLSRVCSTALGKEQAAQLIQRKCRRVVLSNRSFYERK